MTSAQIKQTQRFHASRLSRDKLVTLESVSTFLCSDVNKMDCDEFFYALDSGLIGKSANSYHVTCHGNAVASLTS